jgi:pilus assembly protein Flp/PilA
MNTIKKAVAKFSREEDGAQVVEYALIIAVVSIALVLALGNGTTGIASKFAAFVTRVGTCLSTGTC